MDQPERTREVHIHVNERPVILGTHEATGLVIKETAIAQHVPIQSDFVLSEELGGHRSKVVGDEDKIDVKEGSRFLAIPPDDNS